MGALPSAMVPEGPVRTLFSRLHELHHRAGWPSLRDMAKEVGCSPTTISAAFSRPVVPRWGLLELIVETLGGDTATFHRLWLDASHAGEIVLAETARPSVDLGVADLAAVPHQLPADVSAFEGRADELAELDELIATHTSAVISGTAGVGKTALAVHWAQRAAGAFPAGQLYLDLRGYDPARPISAAAALESMLRSLGVNGAAIPQEQADRAAHYRTTVAGRRLLIVLDNANSVEQVRDLLPGGPPCFVLITSRDTMRGLVARHGAARINLDLLPTDESVALLRRLVGRRVDEEPQAATNLAQRCARLPLALRIAAELANGRPARPLADLLAELDATSGPLAALTTGDDDYSAVSTVLSWSCAHLSAPAAELFALLGVHPGRRFDRRTAAAVGDLGPGTGFRLLDELARAHLIEESSPAQFGMHDLLRSYARELAAELDDDARAAARTRLRTYYLDAAAGAVTLAFPHRKVAADTASPFADVGAAREWLRVEWPNLIALAEDEPGRSSIAVSTLLADYLDERSFFDAGRALHELALTYARQQGDRRGEGVALNNLALIDRNRGRFDAALVKHTEALASFREAGDRCGEGRALHGVRTVRWRQGDYRAAYEALHTAVDIQRSTGDRADEGTALYGLGIASRRLGMYAEAEAHHRAAIELLRAANDLAGEGRALNNLGVVHMFMGRHEDALGEFRRALEIHTQMDRRLGQGVAQDNIGSTLRRIGQLDEAMAAYEVALSIYLDIGYRVGEGDALRGIGATLGRLGRHPEAAEALGRAIALGRQIGEVEVTTGALTDLGEVQMAAGDVVGALRSFEGALELSGQAGDPYCTARALAGSAAARFADGDVARAGEQWRAALDLFVEMGLPDADEVRERLDRLPV